MRIDCFIINGKKEIFFYNPLKREVIGDNRMYKKTFERLIEKSK